MHVAAALLALPLLVGHLVTHWQPPRRVDASRRTVLSAGLVAAGGLLAVLGVDGITRGLGLPGARDRPTGSSERGSFEPALMPVTQWFLDAVPSDVPTLRVVVDERAVEPDLEALAQEQVEAVLDCTGGWYAAQRWGGVRLDRLLPPTLPVGARSIDVVSVTGYRRRFPPRRRAAAAARNVCRRSAPLAGARGAPAADRFGAARVLVGEMGGRDRGQRRSAVGAAAVPADVSVAPYDADGLDFLAGMGEDNVEEFGLALAGERRLRPYLEQQLPALAAATAAELVRTLATLLLDIDRRCLTGPVGDDFAAAMASSAAGGADGWVDDDLAFTRPWGFAIAQIQGPVSLWQGSEDLMVPFSHAQWLAEHIPGVAAHLETGEGHLSINVGSIDRILDELISVARH